MFLVAASALGVALWGLVQAASEAELTAWYRRESVCIERGDIGLGLQQ